jgi:hypothetical protein
MDLGGGLEMLKSVKRFTVILIAMIMVLGMFPGTVFATEGEGESPSVDDVIATEDEGESPSVNDEVATEDEDESTFGNDVSAMEGEEEFAFRIGDIEYLNLTGRTVQNY